MARYQLLHGLPPYGPAAEPFSATGQGAHREGLVVRFSDFRGQDWVGNFQPGGTWINAAVDHPDGRRVIVVAEGAGYVVDPDDRSYREYVGGQIADIIPVPSLGLLLGNGLWFEAIGRDGPLWTSDRISWDGMQNLEVRAETLSGEAWDPMTNSWVAFDLDLSTGRSRGGSFEGYRLA